jgi:DNA-binding transcriptional regulator GbsR (MarR family)
MYFFSKSAYENYIGIDVKTLMEELDVSKPTVTKGLKDLEKNNILVKYKNVNDARRHDYFINPITAWRGNSFTRNEAIKKIKSGDSPGQLDLFNIPEEKKSALKPNSDF